MVRNRFRCPGKRAAFSRCVSAYEAKHPDLFTKDGKPRRGGSSVAEMFWKGYDGVCPRWDRTSKELVCYAYWCAGVEVRLRDKEAS